MAPAAAVRLLRPQLARGFPGLHTPCFLAVVSQTFVQQEQLLHRDFSTLITDAQYLKAYGAPAERVAGIGGYSYCAT